MNEFSDGIVYFRNKVGKKVSNTNGREGKKIEGISIGFTGSTQMKQMSIDNKENKGGIELQSNETDEDIRNSGNQMSGWVHGFDCLAGTFGEGNFRNNNWKIWIIKIWVWWEIGDDLYKIDGLYKINGLYKIDGWYIQKQIHRKLAKVFYIKHLNYHINIGLKILENSGVLLFAFGRLSIASGMFILGGQHPMTKMNNVEIELNGLSEMTNGLGPWDLPVQDRGICLLSTMDTEVHFIKVGHLIIYVTLLVLQLGLLVTKAFENFGIILMVRLGTNYAYVVLDSMVHGLKGSYSNKIGLFAEVIYTLMMTFFLKTKCIMKRHVNWVWFQLGRYCGIGIFVKNDTIRFKCKYHPRPAFSSVVQTHIWVIIWEDLWCFTLRQVTVSSSSTTVIKYLPMVIGFCVCVIGIVSFTGVQKGVRSLVIDEDSLWRTNNKTWDFRTIWWYVSTNCKIRWIQGDNWIIGVQIDSLVYFFYVNFGNVNSTCNNSV